MLPPRLVNFSKKEKKAVFLTLGDAVQPLRRDWSQPDDLPAKGLVILVRYGREVVLPEMQSCSSGGQVLC